MTLTLTLTLVPVPTRNPRFTDIRLQLRLRILNSTCNSPVAPRRLSCQISANQGEAKTSANVNKQWKTIIKGNDVITYVISANQHFASTFPMQIFKFQRRSCKFLLPFPAPSPEHPGEFSLRLQGLCHQTRLHRP